MTKNLYQLDNVIRRISMLAKKFKPTYIIVLGDLLDTHEKANVYVYNKAIELLDVLSSITKTFLLIGNHDRPNNSVYLTEEHFFTPLKKWPNLVVVDKVMEEIIYQSTGERIVLVPYVPPGRFMDALNTINFDRSKTRAIFCHQEFYGCSYGPRKSEVGDKWDDSFPLIVSGHIHQYNWLQDNILYVGTPYQIAYNEEPEKGVVILSFKDDGTFHEKRFGLGVTKKKVIDIDIDNLNSLVIPSGYDVKLIIRGEQSKIKSKASDLKKLPVPFQIKHILEEKPNTNIDKSYGQILYDLVKDHEFALKVFNDIVGK